MNHRLLKMRLLLCRRCRCSVGPGRSDRQARPRIPPRRRACFLSRAGSWRSRPVYKTGPAAFQGVQKDEGAAAGAPGIKGASRVAAKDRARGAAGVDCDARWGAGGAVTAEVVCSPRNSLPRIRRIRRNAATVTCRCHHCSALHSSQCLDGADRDGAGPCANATRSLQTRC